MSGFSKQDHALINLGVCIKNQAERLGIEHENIPLEGVVVRIAQRSLAAPVVAEEPEPTWQWCYVEKWIDGSGVYERVTFDGEAKAWKYLRDNAERVEGLNQEFLADDRIVASVEKRRTCEPGEWVPVKHEGEAAKR